MTTLATWWRLPWRIENRFTAIINQLQTIEGELMAKATQADLDALKAEIVNTITAEKEEVLAKIAELQAQIDSDGGVTTEALTGTLEEIKAAVQGIYSAPAPAPEQPGTPEQPAAPAVPGA